VLIRAINQHDLRACFPQRLGRRKTAKTFANNNDAWD
jgi:hypothetical protein